MKTVCVVAIALFSACAWSVSIAQPMYPRVIAQFPGASLKWVDVAEPEFQKRGFDLSHYNVAVAEYEDAIVVSLTSLDASKKARGSSGTHPAFDVEIAKGHDTVIRSYYVR